MITLEPAVINKAIAMRKTGMIYTDIARQLDISLGSVSNIMKHAVFTEEENKRIKEVHFMIRSEARGRVKPNQKITFEKQIESISAARLRYTQQEMQMKPILEQEFNSGFKKEMFENIVIPFVSKEYLILVSMTPGLDHHLVKKVAIIASMEDKRKRIVFLAKTDGLAAHRLSHERFAVTVRAMAELLH